MRFTKTLLYLLFFMQLQAQSDIPVFPDLAGDDLLNAIVKDYKPVSILNYGQARDTLYGRVYNENDTVRCVYSGHALFLPEGVDPSIHLYMNDSSEGINCEHTYPRSKGADSGNAFSDMHHLFPTRIRVNAARASFPFGDIDDSQTTTWYYLNQAQNNIPTTDIDLYSEVINGRFEPREQFKGNIARAIFYFFAMYKNEALSADPNFFESQREALCKWHKQDPVDSLEWERTYMIGEYQNDLPNPFILDSTLASRCFCGSATPVQEAVQSNIRLYPNPVTDRLNITMDGTHTVQVTDVLGRVFMKKEFSDKLQLNLSSLTDGTYFIVVNESVFRVLKQ